MFKLIECDRRYKFVLLRCQKCNDGNAFDNENFEVLEKDKVIVKKGIKITCPTCGNSQSLDNRLITLEPPISFISQTVHTPRFQPSEKDKWDKWLEFMATLEWE